MTTIDLRVTLTRAPGPDAVKLLMEKIASRSNVESVVELKNDGFSRLLPDERTRVGGPR